MADRKKTATKTKPHPGQRTLFDLFPLKKIEKSLAIPPSVPIRDAQSSSNNRKYIQLQNDCEQELISEGSQPVDEPPDSPIIISEASSTPSSQHIVIGDEEIEPQITTTGNQESLEGSQEDPIVIDSSPPRTRMQRNPPKTLWSIFTPRTTPPVKPVQRRSKSGLGAPLPSAETQHVRGPQTSYSSTLDFSRRSPKDIPATERGAESGIRRFLVEGKSQPLTYLEFDMRSCESEEDKVMHLGTISEEQRRSYPILDKLTSTNVEHIACPAQLWTDKWRPKCAVEVLGNEKSALYLRDWLRALALEVGELTHSDTDQNGKDKGRMEPKGVKRPRIIRAVNKFGRKRRKVDSDEEDDSWIVYDDESDGEVVSGDEQRDAKDRIDATPEQHTFEQLTNTIILAGPPGCGKTACVYACAEELNWDIFEVYPGIGRRNGASIDNLIGDVGKNHLVRKTTLTRGAGTQDTTEHTISNLNDGTALHDFGFLESAKPEVADVAGVRPRQSLVLLEEVDILFKEDSNFWPTVVNFLRDCKRPVVCTCNDISLVPTLELPVQNILAFEPCPPIIAASYLQAICCNEGWIIDHNALRQLYEMPFETFSNGYDLPLQAADLRRTMHKLQLWCSTSEKNSRVRESGGASSSSSCDEACWPTGDDRRSLGKSAELLSYLDGEGLRRPRSETARPSADDEVGHTILFEEGEGESEFGDGYADRGPLINCAATRFARGWDDAEMAGAFRGQMGYQRRIREALGRLAPGREVLWGRTAVYTEYAAYVRLMVAGEDAQSARLQTAGGGRGTRNSRRYWRAVEVSEAERAGLRW
ncbi:hypothetical protein AX15_007689 [Amanita polypyramis BW_CC]|nr:hypothetical protein AX15_007689 [Amanita polypyramis BW_CC]